jgi:hypothetical protein
MSEADVSKEDIQERTSENDDFQGSYIRREQLKCFHA